MQNACLMHIRTQPISYIYEKVVIGIFRNFVPIRLIGRINNAASDHKLPCECIYLVVEMQGVITTIM